MGLMIHEKSPFGSEVISNVRKFIEGEIWNPRRGLSRCMGFMRVRVKPVFELETEETTVISHPA